MVRSFSRGHEIYWDGELWRYSDNGAVYDDTRSCKRCGRQPTPEGYDACLGCVPGATSVCCGHGVESPFVILSKETSA